LDGREEMCEQASKREFVPKERGKAKGNVSSTKRKKVSLRKESRFKTYE